MAAKSGNSVTSRLTGRTQPPRTRACVAPHRYETPPRLLAIIANVNTHLELLAHDRLDRRLYLPCQFGLVDRLA